MPAVEGAAAAPVATPKKEGGLLSLYGAYLRLLYRRCGLQQQQVLVEPDTSLSVWAPVQPGGGKSAPRSPLLLLHGAGAQAMLQWDKQVGLLSRAGFDLYIPDLVFFGDSITTGPERSEAFQARCCVKLMEHFKVPQYDVMGYSYGGTVAYNMALAHPERVKRLILMCAGVLMGPEDMKKFVERMGMKDVTEMQPKDVEGVKRMLRLAYHKPPWLPNFVLKEVLKSMFASPERIERQQQLFAGFRKRMESFDPATVLPVKQECLAIYGEFDPMFPPEMAARMKNLLGERLRTITIAETAHMPQSERPADVSKAVTTFLAK
eukprot:TRINITY_DN13505_c0_g1_i1.p1 TRINITY_DN13505_c0_g1~~TRINITY_DN13505_c0_g1_i1.p1  ORF type:complete len:320 (+),score=82.08 TRINITY_DN13505_c0_g1_i1:614-1573(+)